MNHEFKIRDALEGDIPFIYSTFLKSYKKDSPLGKSCRDSIFYENYRFVIDKILEDSDVLVACKIDQPEIIFGYIIYDKSILHYIFVKELFRKFGIASSLYELALEGTPRFTQTTHRTFTSDKINHQIPHNPMLLYAATQPGAFHA